MSDRIIEIEGEGIFTFPADATDEEIMEALGQPQQGQPQPQPLTPEQKEEPVPFMDSTRRDRLNLRLGLEPTEPEALTKEQLDVGGFNWEKDYERATRNMDSIDALLKKAEAHQAKIDEWLNNPGEDEEFNEQKKRHQLTLDAIEDFEREQQDFLKRYTPTKEQYDHIVGLTKTHNAANPKKLKTPEEIAWENKGMRGMLFARDGDGFEGVRIGGNNRDAVLMAHLDEARKDPEPLWWVEKLPIAGGIVSYVDSWKKSKSAKLLEQSPPKGFGYHLTGKGEKPQPEDWDAIMEYSNALKDMAQYIAYAEAQEDKGWLNKVGDITASLPGYAVEFWLTGPVGAAAKAGTTKLGQKVITEAMQKKMATSFAGRVGIRAGQAGRYTVAAGAQTLANPWMIARNLGQEMEAGITVSQDPATGNMTYALDGESMPINLSRAYAYSLAEIGTERLGEVIQSTKAFKAMRGAFSKSKELNPALTPRAFIEQANKAGYQGFALELAEERANELSTYIYDVLGGKEEFTRESLDRRFTSPLEKDFYAELASFALFGAGMKMGQTGVNQAQLELSKTKFGEQLLGFDRKQWTAEEAAKKIQRSDELQNLQGHTGRVVLFEDGNTGKVVAVKVGSEAEETTSGIIQAWAQNNNLKIRGVYHMKAGVPSEVFTATWNQSDGQKQHTFNSVEDARAYAQSLMELGNQEAAKSIMDQAYQSMQPPSEIDALDMKDSGVINRVRLGKARVKLSEVQNMLGGQVTETDLGYKVQFDSGVKLHINFQELPFDTDSILVSALSMGAVTQEDINQADTQEKREELARSVTPAGFFTQIEINGKPIDNNYLIQLDLNADSATFRHETMHFFRETGVISEKQWDSITDRVAPKKKEELRKAKEDQAPEEVIRELDRSIEEDVARIVEGRTDTRLPGESRLIDEVIKLLDKLRNLTRYVNTRSLWRGMESGQFAGVAPKKGAGAAAGMHSIQAFHGSPIARLTGLSTDAIGSGQGAIARGHGLYFSSAQEVAEHYKGQDGSGYKVELAPEQDELLQWDKTLADQPERVQKALRDSGILEGLGGAAAVYARRGGVAGKALTGEKLYWSLVEQSREKMGYDRGLPTQVPVGAAAEASSILRTAGVRGVRYTGKQGVEKGKDGFVIFSDKDVRVTGHFSVQGRDPILKAAAQEMRAGNLTGEQYRSLVQELDPILPRTSKPTLPSEENLEKYLGKKRAKLGLPKGLEKGNVYDFRIDIGTYNRSYSAVEQGELSEPVVAITAHKEKNFNEGKSFKTGKALGYGGIAKIKGWAKVKQDEDYAERIAAGVAKNTISAISGKYNPSQSIPRNIMDMEQVGYNPIRSSKYYDKRNGQPVLEMLDPIIIGTTVFAKELKYDPNSARYSIQKAPEGFRDMDHWVSTLRSLDTFGNPLTPGAKENLSVPDDPQGALQTLIDSTDVPEVKEAAKTLQKIFEGQPVEKRTKVQAVDVIEKGMVGVYYPSDDDVKLFKGGQRDLILMHELVHAASSRVLDQYTRILRRGIKRSSKTGTNYIKRLKGLRDQIVSGVRLNKDGSKEKITPSGKDLLVARIIDAYTEAVDKMGPKELVGHELKNTPTISVIETDGHYRMVISNPGKPGAYDVVKDRHNLFRKIVTKAGLGRGDYTADMGNFFLTENAVKHLQQKGEEGALKGFEKANHHTEIFRFTHTERRRKQGVTNTRKIVTEIGHRNYGFANISEFLAEAASNPAFMMQLAQIDLGEATEVKGWMTPGAKLRDRTAKSIRGLMASNSIKPLKLPTTPTGPGYANPLPPPSGYKPEHILKAERTLKKIEGRHTMLDEVAHIIADFHETKKPGDKYWDQPARYPMYSVQANAEYMEAAESGNLEKAQGMVDQAAKAAGYTIGPVYHGSRSSDIKVFETNQPPKRDKGYLGAGTYFSTSKSIAESYAGKDSVYSAYLKLDNPKVLDFPSFIDYQQWREMYEFPHSMSAMEVKQSLQFEGHDGVIARVENESPEEIVAFEPNQIKSADPITRDDAGNIIPLAERFQPSSDDIRYSVQGGFEGEMTVANIPAQSQFGQMYSRVAEAIREMPLKKATFSKWMGRLKKLSEGTPKVYRLPENFPAGEKAFAREELEELGIDTLFPPGQELTKEEVLEMVEFHPVPKIDFKISGEWALMGTKYEGMSIREIQDAQDKLIDNYLLDNTPVLALREAIYGKDTALQDRESLVIASHYGLEDGVRKPVYQVAQQFGISADRARTILNKARVKLRNSPELRELYYSEAKNQEEVRFISSLLEEIGSRPYQSINLPGAQDNPEIGYGMLTWQQKGIDFEQKHKLKEGTVAHARFNYNEEQLDLIESQSDLHQLGDKEGYRSPQKFRNTEWEPVTSPEKAEEYLKKGKEEWDVIVKNLNTAIKAHYNASEKNAPFWKDRLEDAQVEMEGFDWMVSQHVSEERDLYGNPLFLERRLKYDKERSVELNRHSLKEVFEFHRTDENVSNAVQWDSHIVTSRAKNVEGAIESWRQAYYENYDDSSLPPRASHVNNWNELNFRAVVQAAAIQGKKYVAFPSHWTQVAMIEGHPYHPSQEPGAVGVERSEDFMPQNRNEPPKKRTAMYTRMVFGTLNEAKRMAKKYGTKIVKREALGGRHLPSNDDITNYFSNSTRRADEFYHIIDANSEHFHDLAIAMHQVDPEIVWLDYLVKWQGSDDVAFVYNKVMREENGDMDIDVLTEIIEANDLLSLKHPDGGTVADFFIKDKRFGGRYGKPIIFNALEVSPRMAGPIARYSVQKKLPNLNTPEFFQTPLAIEGTGKNGRISINDVAGALEDYTLGKHKKPLTDDELGLAALFVNAKDEVAFQLEQPVSGRDFYHQDQVVLEKYLQKIYPELKQKHNMVLFKALLSPTSFGQNPKNNVVSATKIWESGKPGELQPYQPGGKGWTLRAGIVAGMVEMHNRLVQDMGPKKAAKWLTSKQFIGNKANPQPGTLRYYNNNVSGKEGDKVLGGYIWGPKGGPFFFNNIGIQDKVTMDMWFSRSWNRIMGTLIENGEIVEAPRNDAERDTMIGVVDKLSKDLGLTHEEVQAVWWFYEQQLWQALGANVKSLTFIDGAEAVLESKGVQPPKVRGYNRAAAKGRQAAQSQAISRGGKYSVQVTPESQARINNIEAAGAYRSPDPEVAPAYGSSYVSDFQKRHLARASQKLIYFAGSKVGQEKGVLQIEEAYAAAAVRKSQAELTRQLTDAAYKSQPGLKLPQWMQVGKWASRLRDFMGISLPLAAHLNATNRDNQGNFIFADFEMRAGLMSEKDFRQGKHQIGDKILVLNNLTKENDELVVGAFISTPDGRSGYQLLRTMTADRQAEIYNHFKREYSDLIWAVDMYIDPALRGTRNVVNGVEIPAFNRFSIEEMMAESDDGFQAVAGYTPDVVATRSLIGGILGLFNPGAGSRSPGRKYKTGKGRESGNVQDLFSGHSIRAFQMLQEKHRQRFRDAVLKYAAKPLAEGESPTNLPEGWVMLDTGMNDLIQRVKKFRQFIEDETTEGQDFYKKFLGELYAKRGRQLKIRREVVEVLMQQYIRIQFNNRLYNIGAWLIRNSKGLLLAHPGTMVVNAATNDFFTMEAAFQELLKGITLLPVNPSEGEVSLRMARELFVGNFMHRFPSLRKMAGIETHYDQVVEEAIPEEVFASSVSLQDLDVKYEVSASQYLREGELGAAALQLLQYGNIDVRAKQRMTYAFLKAHAVQAAKDQGLKDQAMRDFVDRFMKNPPRDLMAKAADAANLEFLNYADSPAWLQWFAATPYTAVIMPFPRFGYHFLAKQITKAAAVKDVIGKVPAEKRADAFGKLMAFSMFGLGGTGLILDMLLRDDDDEEDEARERIGTNYVKYTDPVTGEPRTKQIDREMITTARVNVSWYARQMGLGTEREDDFWLRVRNYPMIAMGGNLILAESDAKNHGAWEGAKTYIRNTADLSKDFFSVGAGVKVPTKIWAEINSEPGSQKKAPAFDPYATNVPLGFYLVEQTASTLVPGTRQLNDLSVLIEPARPKKTESKTLEYKPGPWEAVRANHVGAVLSRWAEKEGLIEPMPRQGSVVTMAITGQPGDPLERRIQRIEGLSKLEGPEANIFLDPRSYRPRLATISEQSIPERTRSLELLRIMGLNLKPVNRGAYEEQIKPNPQLPSSGY